MPSTRPDRTRRGRTTRQATCNGCGIRRRTETRGDYYCRTCKPATRPEPTYDNEIRLDGGRWVLRGLVWRWQPELEQVPA